MSKKYTIGSSKTNYPLVALCALLLLILSLTVTGCASGTPKTEAWKFDEETIQKVEAKCTGSFSESSGGKFSALWANKRAILRESRDCAEAARILAEQARNRNKVINNE